MRVISGSARGCKLQPVPGENTRPTTDRVKESIFNIIQLSVRDARVLDLFAGTGQMGIEALSRGAKSCDFIEHSRAAQSALRNNLKVARVEDRSRVTAGEYEAFLSRQKPQSFDLIFLDPPYGGKILNNALFLIERFDILSPSGIILCESAEKDQISTTLSRGRNYQYGTIQINVLRRADQTEESI